MQEIQQTESTTTIETILAQRKEKADKMRQLGVDPYPARVKIDNKIAQVRTKFEYCRKKNRHPNR